MKKKQGVYCVSTRIKEAPSGLRTEEEETVNIILMAKDWGH